MADRALSVTRAAGEILPHTRVARLLSVLELMAAGDTEIRLPLSPQHDELDAIAHGINVLVGELEWSSARVLEAQEARATELRAAVASAEEANAAKNIFLRNVSHEMRTPIAAMLGFAELLESPDLTHEDRTNLVRRLQANGQAVLALLGDLLELARLDADKVVLRPEPVPVIDIVREVLASLELESRAKGLEVRVEFGSNALGTVQTDRMRLRQILVNLVANAIKFTTSGSVLISLETVTTAADQQWWIDVADTGIGIAEERYAHLFEPFEQSDAAIADRSGGTGLGLALSRRLAELLGGSLVLLRSAPDQGTTFRLVLNPLLTPDAESATDSGTATGEGSAISGLRILLAEDHADMQLALRRLLERAGASVESARDGREAAVKALWGSFDVVLMDLRMPHMDGIQATRLLRNEGCVVPIVALTADPAKLRRAEALDAGCDACLGKPFALSDLITTIRTLQIGDRLPTQRSERAG